jgi:hypothetical protein
MIRNGGPVCPQCGHEAIKRSRFVAQTDGRLQEHFGDIYVPQPTAVRPDTVKLWSRSYYRAKNSKNRMTFRQAEGLFFKEQHYRPPHDLPLMPKEETDWFLPVADVPIDRLIGYCPSCHRCPCRCEPSTTA